MSEYKKIFTQEYLIIYQKLFEQETDDVQRLVKELLDIHVKEANLFYFSKEYEKAIELYERVKEYIKENNLEELVSEKIIHEKIRKINFIVEVKTLIEKGDNASDKKLYEQAKRYYKKAIEIIKAENIQDVFSTLVLEELIRSMPDFSNAYLDIQGGIFLSLSRFDNVLPYWFMGFNFRLNKFFTLGIGINLLNMKSFESKYYQIPIEGFGVYFIDLELFGKLSIINTYYDTKINHELLIKVGLLLDTYPSLSYAFGIGGGLTPEYIIHFTEFFGLSLNTRFWFIYRFEPNYTPSLDFSAGLGFVIKF